MLNPTITCKVLVYNDRGEPLVTQELERNRLEIEHGHRRTVIQLPKGIPVFVFSHKVGEKEVIDYGEPIKTSLGRTVASIRRAAKEERECDDDIIIVRNRGINYNIMIPRDTGFQVYEEEINTAA